MDLREDDGGGPVNHRGFTLLELLVVVAIIALLAGMAMPLIAMARQASRVSATRSVMARVDAALREFKTDYRVYPYQRTYADLDAGEEPANRLAYQLGRNISAAQRDLVLKDVAAAAAQYAYSFTNWADGPRGPLAYLLADVMNGEVQASVVTLNRMAQERVRIRVLSGDVDAIGQLIRRGDGTTVRDLRAKRVLATAFSAGGDGPGWAVDYLAGELDPRAVSGQQILDGWRRPMAYICRTAPGCRPTTVLLYRNTASLADLSLYDLDPLGRIRLDAGLDVDTAFLPDPATLRHSDRRVYAAPGFEDEFELWSCGRDGAMGWMRDDARNRDNIGASDYDRSIR